MKSKAMFGSRRSPDKAYQQLKLRTEPGSRRSPGGVFLVVEVVDGARSQDGVFLAVEVVDGAWLS